MKIINDFVVLVMLWLYNDISVDWCDLLTRILPGCYWSSLWYMAISASEAFPRKQIDHGIVTTKHKKRAIAIFYLILNAKCGICYAIYVYITMISTTMVRHMTQCNFQQMSTLYHCWPILIKHRHLLKIAPWTELNMLSIFRLGTLP